MYRSSFLPIATTLSELRMRGEPERVVSVLGAVLRITFSLLFIRGFDVVWLLIGSDS
jgi:hypothetical protein